MKYSLFFIVIYAALVFNFSFLNAIPQAAAPAVVSGGTVSTTTNVITPELSKDTNLGIYLLSTLSHDKNVAVSPITMWSSLYALHERLAPNTGHAELVSKLKAVLSLTTDEKDPSKIINLEDLTHLLSGIKQKGGLSIIFEKLTETELSPPNQINEVFKPYPATGSYFHYRPDYTTINDWVENNSMGTIREFLKYGTIPDYLVVQSFSVQGPLSIATLTQPTTTLTFTDGTQSTSVPALNLFGEHLSLQTDTFDAVTIPYANGLYDVTIIKPKLAATLTEEQLANALLQMATETQRKPFIIQIPTFDTHTNRSFSMEDLTLGSFQMPSYFSAGTTAPLAFGGFHHQVRLRLLASDIQAANAPMPTPQPPVMAFDRPFYYFLTKRGGPNNKYMSTHCAAYIRKVHSQFLQPNVGTETVHMLSKQEASSQIQTHGGQVTTTQNPPATTLTTGTSIEDDFPDFDTLSDFNTFQYSSLDDFPDTFSDFSFSSSTPQATSGTPVQTTPQAIYGGTPAQTTQQVVQQIQTPSSPYVDPF